MSRNTFNICYKYNHLICDPKIIIIIISRNITILFLTNDLILFGVDSDVTSLHCVLSRLFKVVMESSGGTAPLRKHLHVVFCALLSNY